MFMEDLAFLPSFDMAEKERKLVDWRGGGGDGEEPNHTTTRKPDSL
jgi:hypothetical protein